PHYASTLGGRQCYLIDEGGVQVEVLSQAELFGRADTPLFATFLADPERKRGAPVARARDGPVDIVLEPVAHAPGLDVCRHPVGGPVVVEQLLLALGRSDVPAVEGVVDQRGAAA